MRSSFKINCSEGFITCNRTKIGSIVCQETRYLYLALVEVKTGRALVPDALAPSKQSFFPVFRFKFLK